MLNMWSEITNKVSSCHYGADKAHEPSQSQKLALYKVLQNMKLWKDLLEWFSSQETDKFGLECHVSIHQVQ
jgi:hypothetical protein